MQKRENPDVLKIPAYLRTKAIINRDRQRLLWTAWDRKEAGIKPNSKTALGVVDKKSKTKSYSEDLTSSKFLNTSSFKNNDAKFERHNYKHSRISSHSRYNLTNSNTNEPIVSKIVSKNSEDKAKCFKKVGLITHFFEKISVAVVELDRQLKLGDTVLIESESEMFLQEINEMQIDRQPVRYARKGVSIGLKVSSKVKIGGFIYIVK